MWNSRSVGARSDPDGFGNVMAVSPRLHETGNYRRGSLHRRSVPGELGGGVDAFECLQLGGPGSTPPVQYLGRRHRPTSIETEGHVAVDSTRQAIVDLIGKRIRVRDRLRFLLVEESQMRDRVTNRPRLCRCDRVPDWIPQARQQPVEVFLLLSKIVNQIAHGQSRSIPAIWARALMRA